MYREFPYLVTLRYGWVGDKHRCGGSILNQLWVLTAAHCVTNAGRTQIIVMAGKYNIGVQEPNQQVITVQYTVVHPYYDSDRTR